LVDDEDIHGDSDVGSGGSGDAEGSSGQEIAPTVTARRTFPSRKPILNTVATDFPLFTWDWKRFITKVESTLPTSTITTTTPGIKPTIASSKHLFVEENRVDICKHFILNF